MADHKTGNAPSFTHKRKSSNDSISEVSAKKHESICSSTAVIVIDPDGDLNMVLNGGTLKVSRKTLSLSSLVFLAMLGHRSQFREVTEKTLDADGVQVISFEDDDYESMKMITRIMHLQNDQVPDNISFAQLYQIAVLCDKYNLERCLGLWVNMWSGPYLNTATREGYEGWLFISIVFGFEDVFKDITKELILSAKSFPDGRMVTAKGYDFSEHVSHLFVDWIVTWRTTTTSNILTITLQEREKLLNYQCTPVCKAGGQHATSCDAINLGLLLQKFPEIIDPRDHCKLYYEPLRAVLERAETIRDVSGSILFRFGDHRQCGIGLRLAAECKKLLGEVQGLELRVS